METLTEKNKEYLIALPERKELEFLGHSFFLSHKLEDFLPEVNHYIIRPYSFSPLEKAIPKEEMNKVFFDFLNQNPLVKEHLQSLPKGIYCFGHNHMPWILHYEEKTFINPGAIGGSLDGNPRLSYIQLTLGKNQLQGEIIRLSYNAEKMEEDIRLSSLYQRAGDWAELTIESLYTAEDEVIWLFENMKKWAKEEKRDHVFPIENKLWAQSVKRWEREKPFVRKYGENRETT